MLPRFTSGRLALVAATFLCGAVSAADLRSVSVDYVDERYYLESVAWFDASRADLYRVLTDYKYFERFSSAFVESRNLPPDTSGRPWFYTRMEGCVLFWCQSMRRRGYLLLKPPDEIVAIAVREGSDFLFSRERWRLESEGDGTRMTYNFQMEPDFWVPPLIGPFIIKRTLREGGVDAIDRIEALAQGREPKP